MKTLAAGTVNHFGAASAAPGRSRPMINARVNNTRASVLLIQFSPSGSMESLLGPLTISGVRQMDGIRRRVQDEHALTPNQPEFSYRNQGTFVVCGPFVIRSRKR